LHQTGGPNNRSITQKEGAADQHEVQFLTRRLFLSASKVERHLGSLLRKRQAVSFFRVLFYVLLEVSLVSTGASVTTVFSRWYKSNSCINKIETARLALLTIA
jgi:hypothetical protein